METQKIINLLNDSNNEESKFATKNGMLQTAKQQKLNQNKYTNFETESIKSNLCDYSDAFICDYLVTEHITVASKNNTDVAFKNCALFSTCKAE